MAETSVERLLGKLEEGIAGLKEDVHELDRKAEASEEKASTYRGEMRKTLNEVNDKIDPIKNDVDLLKLQVQAHEVVIKSFAEERSELAGALKVSRWLVRAMWLFGGGALLMWGEHIKDPWNKIVQFFFKA